MAHPQTANQRTNFGFVNVHESDDWVTPSPEPARTNEGLTQIACTDDDDWPFVVNPKFSLNLKNQEGNLVPNPTSPITAEVTEIFTDLGSVNTAHFGDFLRGHADYPRLCQLKQNPQIHRKPRNRGFCDFATRTI